MTGKKRDPLPAKPTVDPAQVHADAAERAEANARAFDEQRRHRAAFVQRDQGAVEREHARQLGKGQSR